MAEGAKCFSARCEISGFDFDAAQNTVRALMTLHCGIVRYGLGLSAAAGQIGEIERQLDAMALCEKKAAETANLALVALAVLRAAFERRTSVGAHYRSDDPGVPKNIIPD
jgi:L-aspartate oxidase